MGCSGAVAEVSCRDVPGVTTAANPASWCRRMVGVQGTARGSHPLHCNRLLAGWTWKPPGLAGIASNRVPHAAERTPAAGNNDQ